MERKLALTRQSIDFCYSNLNFKMANRFENANSTTCASSTEVSRSLKPPKRVTSLKWRDSYNDSSPVGPATGTQPIAKTSLASPQQQQVQTSLPAIRNSAGTGFSNENAKFHTIRGNSTGAKVIGAASSRLIPNIKTSAEFLTSAGTSSLSSSLEQQPKSANGVPIIVEACLRYLTKNATECVGLFRVSGNKRRVQEMWDHLQFHPYARLSINCINAFMFKHKEFTANDVASFLKRFVKLVVGDEPVVTYDCHGPLVDAATNASPSNYTGRKFRHIIGQLLVPSRRLLLARLCNFLRDFSQYEDTTQMNRTNLATCFAMLVQAPPEGTNGKFSSDKKFKKRRSSIFGRKKSRAEQIREICFAEGERTK